MNSEFEIYMDVLMSTRSLEAKLQDISEVVAIWEDAIKLKQEKLDKYTNWGYETKSIELRAEIRLLAQCVDAIKEHLPEEKGVAIWDSE